MEENIAFDLVAFFLVGSKICGALVSPKLELKWSGACRAVGRVQSVIHAEICSII